MREGKQFLSLGCEISNSGSILGAFSYQTALFIKQTKCSSCSLPSLGFRFVPANHTLLQERGGTPPSWYCEACPPQPLAVPPAPECSPPVALSGVQHPLPRRSEYMWPRTVVELIGPASGRVRLAILITLRWESSLPKGVSGRWLKQSWGRIRERNGRWIYDDLTYDDDDLVPSQPECSLYHW